MPRLYRVIVPVRDFEAGVAFYAGLLADEGEQVSPNRHYFDCGGTILAVVQPFDHAANALTPADQFSPNMQHLYFAVPDLEAVYERARGLEGAEVTSAIERQVWGERSFYLDDPFGNPLCIVDEQTLFITARTE